MVQSLLNFHFRLRSHPSIHLPPLRLAVSWGSSPRALLTNRFLPLFPSRLLFEQMAGSCCRCARPPPNHIPHFPSVPSSTAERSLLPPRKPLSCITLWRGCRRPAGLTMRSDFWVVRRRGEDKGDAKVKNRKSGRRPIGSEPET